MRETMQHYTPPRSAFAPSDLAILERALDDAWSEIKTRNLIDLEKNKALKRAVSLKLFSLVRVRPTDPRMLSKALLSSVRADEAPGNAHI